MCHLGATYSYAGLAEFHSISVVWILIAPKKANGYRPFCYSDVKFMPLFVLKTLTTNKGENFTISMFVSFYFIFIFFYFVSYLMITNASCCLIEISFIYCSIQMMMNAAADSLQTINYEFIHVLKSKNVPFHQDKCRLTGLNIRNIQPKHCHIQ